MNHPATSTLDASYHSRRHEIETYFDRTAVAAWEITASSSNTAGFRGGHNVTNQPQVDMGHASGGTYSVRSFKTSWTYTHDAMPDVTGFTWTAKVSSVDLPPYMRWRIER